MPPFLGVTGGVSTGSGAGVPVTGTAAGAVGAAGAGRACGVTGGRVGEAAGAAGAGAGAAAGAGTRAGGAATTFFARASTVVPVPQNGQYLTSLKSEDAHVEHDFTTVP